MLNKSFQMNRLACIFYSQRLHAPTYIDIHISIVFIYLLLGNRNRENWSDIKFTNDLTII